MKFLRQIRVEKPCHESWDKMGSDEKSRFCDKCQHSVNDLTAMTPEEAAAKVAETHGRMCVRFLPDETGAPIYKGTPAWQKLVAAGVISVAGLSGCQEPLQGEAIGTPTSPTHSTSGTSEPERTIGKIAVPDAPMMGEISPTSEEDSLSQTNRLRPLTLEQEAVVKEIDSRMNPTPIENLQDPMILNRTIGRIEFPPTGLEKVLSDLEFPDES
jgi:hypothetical protein